MKTINKSLIFLSLCLCFSCSKSIEGSQQNELVEMTFSPALSVTTVAAKASLYDSDNLISDDNRGNFSVTAYKAGTSQRHFLGMERVFYMYYPDDPAASRWRFYNSEANSFYERYWPLTYALDFFAYMPYDLADSHVTVDADARTFTCNLPYDKDGQDATREFVFAFEEGMTYDTDEGNVDLEFTHPFSAVNFMLGQAHGNTEIHSVGMTGIYNKGTFAFATDSWEYTAPLVDMNILVGRTTGASGSAGIQLNSHIGGPYLVVPQATDAVSVTVSFTWDGIKKDASVSLGTGNWLPGHIYTYKLTLGDNREDIIADVSVAPWTVVDYRNDIDIQ